MNRSAVAALIMAGGRSERMRAGGSAQHKGLRTVVGMPLIECNLRALLWFGFSRLFVVLEELNLIVPQLKAYWARQYEILLALYKDGQIAEKPPKQSPAPGQAAAVSAGRCRIGPISRLTSRMVWYRSAMNAVVSDTGLSASSYAVAVQVEPELVFAVDAIFPMS